MSGVVDVGEAFEVTFYAAPGALVTASFLDPDQLPVVDGETVIESPADSGKYPKTFVPSVAGVWTVLMNAPGQPQTYWIRARPLLGPLPFAVVGDIVDQFGTMTTAQEGLAGHLVRAASALLRQQVPDLQGNVTSGKIDPEVAALAVTNMVLRVMRNPRGLRAETTGPFSRTYDTSAAAGLLVVTDDDMAAVTPVEEPPPLPDGLGGLGIGTIRVVPGMAPPVDRARWIGGPYGGR